MTRTKTLPLSYLANRGLFARVAKKLKMDPSYVSRVANGKRHNERIIRAIDSEIRKMNTPGRKAGSSRGKRSGKTISTKSPPAKRRAIP
jgi:hypothetical protein